MRRQLTGWPVVELILATRLWISHTEMCVVSFPLFFVIIMLYFNFHFFFLFKKKTLILAIVGVPAALAATWAVELPYIGRKGALAISSGKFIFPLPPFFFCVHYLTLTLLRKIGLTGVFLFASTTARNSNALLGWNCGYTFSSNVGIIFIVSFHVNISDLPIIYIYIYISPLSNRSCMEFFTPFLLKYFQPKIEELEMD